MQEISFITELAILITLAGLVAGGVLYRRQRQKIDHQRREMRRQKFALKKARIIEEIARRQFEIAGQSVAPFQVTPSFQASSPQGTTTQISAKLTPPAHVPPAFDGPQLDLPVAQMPAPNLLPAPLERASIKAEPPARAVKNLEDPKKLPQQIKEAAKPPQPKGGLVVPAPNKEQGAMEKCDHREVRAQQGKSPPPPHAQPGFTLAGPLKQTRRGTKFTPPPDLKLNYEDGLYEQIRIYARWLAGQSHHFFIDRLKGETLEERYFLLMNQSELERRNGHWVDLFAPPDLEAITSTLKNGAALSCPFDRAAIDKLTTPARQIIVWVEKEGSSRYRQVLKESALEAFVNVMEDLKLQIATDEN